MLNKEFDNLLSNRLFKISAVLSSKSKEYAHQGDRLHNFKVAARIDDVSPVKSAWGMAKKHLVSVIDIVNGDLPNTGITVDEKIGDLINYLILMEALLQEERAWSIVETKQPVDVEQKCRPQEEVNKAVPPGKQFRL